MARRKSESAANTFPPWCCVSHMPMRRPRQRVGEGGFFVATLIHAATRQLPAKARKLLCGLEFHLDVGLPQHRQSTTSTACNLVT